MPVTRQLFLGSLLLALGACAASQPVAPAEADTGPMLTDLSNHRVALSNVLASDRANLLVFMTAWCVPCRREQPHVEGFAADNPSVRVTYVIAGSSADDAAELTRERNFKLTSFADPDGEVSTHFDVESTPTLLLLDANGKLIERYQSIDNVPQDRAPVAITDSGTELGTSYEVVVISNDEAKARNDLAGAREVCRKAEQQLSEWKTDSDISRLNREAGTAPVVIEGDLLKVIRASMRVSEATGGAFDITWLPLKALWADAAERNSLPTDAEVAEVMNHVGHKKLQLDGNRVSFTEPGVELGLGAVAKGWIVDAVFLELKRRGYRNIIVNIGGDLRTCGKGPDGPWTFTLVDPFNSTATAARFDLEDGAVATSGNYLRSHEIEGKRYGHIIDPRTGWPAKFKGSVSVFAPDCAMADALATALFVMGPDEGLQWVAKTPGIEAIFVTDAGLKASFEIGD